MTSTYKKLFLSSARSLLSHKSTMNVVGEGKRVDSFRSVYEITHKLYETLFSENPSLDEIRQLASEKKIAKEAFFHQTGVKWIL